MNSQPHEDRDRHHCGEQNAFKVLGLSDQESRIIVLLTRGVALQDRMPPGVMDRTVRITGQDVEQLMRAVALILTKLAQVCHLPPSLGGCKPLEPKKA